MNDINYSETIIVGKQALEHLKQASASLSNARNWGVVDTLGGGLLSGWMKYSDIKDYEKQIHKAKQKLQTFSAKLNNPEIVKNPDIKTDSFIELVDLFKDNILVDLIVQGHIKEAKTQLNETISTIEQILSELLCKKVTDQFKKTA